MRVRPAPDRDPPTQTEFDRTLSHARRNVDAVITGRPSACWRNSCDTSGYPRGEGNRVLESRIHGRPANDRGSLGGGIAALDGYLAADSTGWYWNEALVLRRTAALAQGTAGGAIGTTPSDPTPGTTDTVVVVRRTRDEEISALREQLAKNRDELAKVTAELERIKKRLANPSN